MWGNHWSELFQWLSYDVIEVLTLVACLHIGLGVLLHGRLVVPCLYKLELATLPLSGFYTLLHGLLSYDIVCFGRS